MEVRPLDIHTTSVYCEDKLMEGGKNMPQTRKRINITLPPDTLELIDRVSKDNRSGFINKAVRVYATRIERARLRQQLKKAYRERTREDLAIAREWEPIERQVWERLEKEEESK